MAATPLPTATLADRPHLPAWLRQVALFAAAYALYGVSRYLAVGDTATALVHMHWIVDFERQLGLFRESSVQAALGHGPSETVLNAVYLLSQFAIVPLALTWAYRTDQDVYRQLRNTVFVTWMLAIPIFLVFPTAPPRLGDIGLHGSVAQLNSHLLTPLYNPYAAMPSLHCGFALAVSCAALCGGRTARARLFGLVWAPLVCVAVVATGNHFLLDVVAGLGLTVLGWGLATSVRTATLLHDARARLAAHAHRVAPEAGPLAHA